MEGGVMLRALCWFGPDLLPLPGSQAAFKIFFPLKTGLKQFFKISVLIDFREKG